MAEDRKLPERFLVACRSLRDYKLAGRSVPAGHTIRNCEICRQDIAVSPEGMEHSKRGGYLVCNPCGFDMVKRLKAAGREVAVGSTKAADQQLERIIERAQEEIDRDA